MFSEGKFQLLTRKACSLADKSIISVIAPSKLSVIGKVSVVCFNIGPESPAELLQRGRILRSSDVLLNRVALLISNSGKIVVHS